MKFALIGATAVAAAAFVTPALAQAVISLPGHRDSDTKGKRTMTKNLALAASIMMLTAISGQAFAQTASPNARYWPVATDPSDREVVYAFNAFDSAMAAQTAEPNAYRYHGGPKSND
jgi:hypothetical protein